MKTRWHYWFVVLFLLGRFQLVAAVGTNGPVADLGVTITASTNNVAISNTVTFTLTLTNGGPSNVTSQIIISNFYSPGLQFSGQGGYGGSYSPGGAGTPATWTFSSGIQANTSQMITVTMSANSNGILTNTLILYVPTGVTDPNTNNNVATASVTVTTPTCDLAVGETATTNVNPSTNLTVPFGATFTFNTAFTNLGPSAVPGTVNIVIPVPTNFTMLSNTAGSYGDMYFPYTGVWSIPSVTTSNAYNLGITVLATNVGTFTMPVMIRVPSGVNDPNLSNNTSTVTVTVRNPISDLAIGKTASMNKVTVGQQVVFTLNLTNLGPDYIYTNSGPITVMDLLPSGFNYLFDNSGGAYNVGTGIWTLPSLATLTPATIQITAAGAAVGAYTNTSVANVPPMVTDSNLANNTSSAVVTVVTNGTTNSGTYTLSGYARGCATNGTGFAYVTTTLTGATNLTTTTGTNGFYSFGGLAAGTYAVTPSLPGTAFNPANAVVMLSSNTTVPPFVSGQSIIQGIVTYGTNGPGVPGVPVSLTGDTNRTTLTDAGGHYIFSNSLAGVYMVVCNATNGYNFYSQNSPDLTLSATNCSAQWNFVAKPRTVQLVAMEVTQVIQDWSNSVPLVANKTTYLRAHFQQPYTVQYGLPVTPAPLLLAGASLVNTAQPNAPVYPVNQDGALSVYTTNAYTVRGTWTAAMDFKLPAAWCTAGALTLKLICTNQVTVIATNTVPANTNITVNFTTVPVLPLKYFGWNWTNAGSLVYLSQSAYTNLPSRLVSMYPVPDVTAGLAVQVPIATLNVPPTIPPAIAATEKLSDWVILNSNAKLAICHAFDTLLGGRFGSGGSNWIYAGAVAGPTPTGTSGWAGAVVTSSNTLSANGDMNVCTSFVVSNFYNTLRHTMQHEIGHCLGRPHDVKASGAGVCGESGPMMAYPLMQNVPPPAGPLKPAISPMLLGTNGLVFGLDTLTINSEDGYQPVVSPYIYFDIMSYCKTAPLDRWISPYTYGQLQTVISNNFTPPAVAAAPGPNNTWVYVRGYIDSISGLGGYLPFWTVSTTATNVPSDAGPGAYMAIVYDINGNILEQVPFNPSPFDVEDTDDTAIEEYQFQVAVPEIANMAAIEIMDTTNNQSVASIVDSNTPPAVSSVTLSSTNGGAYTGIGPLVINWQSSYGNPNTPLFYTLQYSTDGGQTWETLDIDISALTYQISSLYLPASTSALIRALASDGFYTSPPAYSSGFTVPNHPPVISINTPANFGVYTLAQQIFFNASVVDPQDGPLNGNSVQWFSSINGFLGYGADLPIQASALSPGLHTITVSATDNENLTSTASVQIYVLNESLPTLSIQTVDNQVILSWPSADTYFSLVSTTNLETGIWTPVTNVPVALDAYQSVILGVTNTAEFFQLQLP